MKIYQGTPMRPAWRDNKDKRAPRDERKQVNYTKLFLKAFPNLIMDKS